MTLTTGCTAWNALKARLEPAAVPRPVVPLGALAAPLRARHHPDLRRLAAWALRNQASYFYVPSDIVARPPAPGQEIRLGGMVEQGSLKTRADGVTIDFVVDDGKGIDLSTPKGFGRTTMTERVKSLGGTCAIESARGNGTAIRIEIPVQREKTERARALELVGGMS